MDWVVAKGLVAPLVPGIPWALIEPLPPPDRSSRKAFGAFKRLPVEWEDVWDGFPVDFSESA